ncbi:hypothetical protein LAZ67_2005794 [Cordylochernes scorpioides]|uniref:Uncharacterized protein n=1 Tax=Cordylochernes scorpioides TaxID=51811 RepID=A0ABY6K4W6_9ARAC|nr:hypothetical protein LAZ67_2005794 [Cordylochernes scorpioides]
MEPVRALMGHTLFRCVVKVRLSTWTRFGVNCGVTGVKGVFGLKSEKVLWCGTVTRSEKCEYKGVT